VSDDRISPIRAWLERLDDHEDDLAWLSPYEGELIETLRRGLNFPPDYHEAVDLLSRVFSHFAERYSRPEDWRHLLMDALVPAMDLRDVRLKADVFRRIGELALKAGKANTARAMFEVSLADAEAGEIDSMVLSALTGLMKLQWFDLTQRVDDLLVQRANRLADESDQDDLRIEFYGALANLQFRQGHLQKALQTGRAALKLAQRSGDKACVGRMALTVAGIYRQIHLVQQDAKALDRADAYLELAAEKLSETEYALQFTALAYEQGVRDLQRQAYAAAEEAFSDALREALRLNIETHVTIARHGLGLAQTHTGKRSEARSNLEAVLEAWRQAGNRYEGASTLQALGYLEQCEGNRQRALEHLQQALRLCDELAAVPQTAALRQHIYDTIAEVQDN
jgi:tetratricopeptide (TPR) repeat protein